MPPATHDVYDVLFFTLLIATYEIVIAAIELDRYVHRNDYTPNSFHLYAGTAYLVLVLALSVFFYACDINLRFMSEYIPRRASRNEYMFGLTSAVILLPAVYLKEMGIQKRLAIYVWGAIQARMSILGPMVYQSIAALLKIKRYFIPHELIHANVIRLGIWVKRRPAEDCGATNRITEKRYHQENLVRTTR